MQPIDRDELSRNKEKLLSWQEKQRQRNIDGLRLNLGSGHLKLPNYVNVDPYTDESDYKDDMRQLLFEKESAVEIVSQHAIEHLPMRDVLPALRNWYEILMPGGTLEIGIPDVELCFQMFLEAPENLKWSNYIWTVYGRQMEGNDPAFSIGQTHMSGFTLGYFIRMLEETGFRMLDAYQYDGNGTPSLFVYAFKPYPPKDKGTLLEQNTAIGTFTNKTTCVPALWASANKHLPHVKFVTRFNRGGINLGMSLLREDFISSGKRYWCFLDDDIQFLNPDIIKNALDLLTREKYGAVSVYSTFDSNVLSKPYNASKLVSRPAKWATGYFILVDSQKVGDVLPDMNLPDPNTSIDTSYSMSIRASGYEIGISADYVYHLFKPIKSNPSVIQKTNEYLMNKWGNFYFDWCQYDGNVIDWSENV